MDGIAYLIRETYAEDAIGQRRPTEEKTMVYVREDSITRTEWRAAGTMGMNPDIVLITPAINFAGEKMVEYNGEKYSIYRTYRNDSDELEMYLEKKVATIGKSKSECR